MNGRGAMEELKLNLTPAVHQAFASFTADDNLLALPLIWADNTLSALPPVHLRDSTVSLQIALNELNTIVVPRTPLYLILRRKGSLIAITFVPYLAKDTERKFFLENRSDLVQQLGEAHFSQSLICKEVSEITDARSWDEREEYNASHSAIAEHAKKGEACKEEKCEGCAVEDLGYKQNKCRLCDRRMKNKITPEALSALATVSNPGAAVQISVDISTDMLTLNLNEHFILPTSLASHLPTDFPSFTFYNHPTTHLLYFIFHSSDNATVQQRMKHTLAIPGLIVHAEDAGVHVDQKIEIHDPDDLVFEGKDEKIGKFRSMYLRNGFKGTELMYEGSERDKKFFDSVV